MSDDLHCCIADCESNQTSKPNLSFHRIPTENFGLRQGWVDIIRASRSEPEWFPVEDAVVCSLHFLPNELIETPGISSSEAKLDYDSGKNIVPSLHLGSTISNGNKNNTTSGFTTHENQSTWGTLKESSSTTDFGAGSSSSNSSNAFVPVKIKQEPTDDGYGSYYNDDGQQPGSSSSSSKLGKRTKPTWSLKELSDDEGERRPRKPRHRNADSDSSEYEPSSSEEAEVSDSGSEVDECGNIISKRKKRRTSFTSSSKTSKTYGYDQRLKLDSVHQSKNVRITPQGTPISSVSSNILKGKGPSFLNFKLKGNSHINIINSNNNNIIFNQMQQKSKVASSSNNNNSSSKILVTTPTRQYGTVNPQIISHLESTRREAPGLKPLNKITTTPELFLMEKVDQIKTLNHITKSDTENYSKCLVIFDQIFKRLSSHPPSDVKKLVTIQLSHLLEIVKQRRENGNSRANMEKLLTTTNRIHTYLRAWPTPPLLNASPSPTVINSTQAKLLLSNPAIAKQQIPPKSDLPSLTKVPDGLNINIVRNNNNNNTTNENNNIVNLKSNGGVVTIQQQQQQIVKNSVSFTQVKPAPASKKLSTLSKDDRTSSPDIISIDDDDDDDDNSNSGFSPVIESVSTVVKKIIPPLPKLNSIAKSNQLTIIPTPTQQSQQQQPQRQQQHSRPLIFNEVVPDPCFATNPHPPKEVPKALGDQVAWMGFTDTDTDFLAEEPVQLNPEHCKAATPLFPLGKYPPNVVIVVEKQQEANVKNVSGNGLNTVKVPVNNRNTKLTTAIININTKLPIKVTNRHGIPEKNIIRTSSHFNKNEFSGLLKAYANKNQIQTSISAAAIIQNNNNQQLVGQRNYRRNSQSKANNSNSSHNNNNNSDEIILISDSDEEGSNNPLQHPELEQQQVLDEQQQNLQSELNDYAQNSININDTITSNASYIETVDDVEDVQSFYDEQEEFQQEHEERQNDDNNEEECLLGI